MIILGIYGALGWDGNILFPGQGMEDIWVHGSSATLFIDGKLYGSLGEERLTRVKHDGRYPENVISQLLSRNSLTPNDVDIVMYVGTPNKCTYYYKRMGYFEQELNIKFPNAKVFLVDHHKCHGVASFVCSGFEEANIFTFDGGGELRDVPMTYDKKYEHSNNTSNLFQGNLKEKTVRLLYSTWAPMGCFGMFYSNMALMAYNLKLFGINFDKWKEERETFEGKVMGLSAYGDHTKIDFIPEPFILEKFHGFPALRWNPDYIFTFDQKLIYLPEDMKAEDLAAWAQYTFEKWLLLFLKEIPSKIKTKKICLGGGCSLNILANSKIIEEGIYEDVFVNPAPNDDGLSFGAASIGTLKFEKDIILPDNKGCIGFDYSDNVIYEAIQKNNIQEA